MSESVRFVIFNMVYVILLIFRYSGILYGITNTSATVTGMIAPLVVGYLTPNVGIEDIK